MKSEFAKYIFFETPDIKANVSNSLRMLSNPHKLLEDVADHFSPFSRSEINQFNSSYGRRVDRASASGAVDSGLIPSRVSTNDLKLVFTASLLDPQH